MQSDKKRVRPQSGGRIPTRCHVIAQAVLMAAGCWGIDANAMVAPCANAILGEGGAAGCGESAVDMAVVNQPLPVAIAAPIESTDVKPDATGSVSTVAAVDFNPAFFSGNVADLSRYAHGNPVSPGEYSIDVLVNGKKRGRFDVQFQAVPGSDVAAPCFTLQNLALIGMEVDRVVERLKAAGKYPDLEPSASVCIPFSEAVPDSTAFFSTSDLKLELTAPQIYLRKQANGYVDPSRWDEGIDAGMVQYNFATYSSQVHGGPNLNSAYLAGW